MEFPLSESAPNQTFEALRTLPGAAPFAGIGRVGFFGSPRARKGSECVINRRSWKNFQPPET